MLFIVIFIRGVCVFTFLVSRKSPAFIGVIIILLALVVTVAYKYIIRLYLPNYISFFTYLILIFIFTCTYFPNPASACCFTDKEYFYIYNTNNYIISFFFFSAFL